jgi:glycosyltransferase involved in cell wall biosynthesis
MHSAFIPLRIALLGTGIPVVGSERTAYRHYRSRPFQRLLLHLSAPLLARMTVNGEGVRNGFPRWIRKRMTVLPNPVANADAKADAVGSKAEKILLTVGGLRPEKDQATLIRAFARISRDLPDWKLRIVGGGALRPNLETLASELGIGSRVEFAGTTEAVDREYANAQLLVMPSIYEGFPNCLAEGLAHGLPAIGFADCPGTNELIQNGVNGVLVAPGNRVEKLAAALAGLMTSLEKRRTYGAAAPESVARFALDRVTDEWEGLLGSLIRSSAG